MSEDEFPEIEQTVMKRLAIIELSDELMAEATCDRTQTVSVEDIRKRFAEQAFKTIDGDS